MRIDAEMRAIESFTGVSITPMISHILSEGRRGLVLNSGFSNQDVFVELRFILTPDCGVIGVRTVWDDLRSWIRQPTLPLVETMGQQFVCVVQPKKGVQRVMCTTNYLGHPDDDVGWEFITDDLVGWWQNLLPIPEDEKDREMKRLMAIVKSGSLKEFENLKGGGRLSADTASGRMLAEMAAAYGNLPVLQWALARGFPAENALAAALFAHQWNSIEFLLSEGHGLDPDIPHSYSGVPPSNYKWMLPPDERERFVSLLDRARQNHRLNARRGTA